VQVKLCVYDILGRLIAVIVDSELEPGVHTVKFEADDLPSGVYFYRINAGGFFSVRKMVLMK